MLESASRRAVPATEARAITREHICRRLREGSYLLGDLRGEAKNPTKVAPTPLSHFGSEAVVGTGEEQGHPGPEETEHLEAQKEAHAIHCTKDKSRLGRERKLLQKGLGFQSH